MPLVVFEKWRMMVVGVTSYPDILTTVSPPPPPTLQTSLSPFAAAGTLSSDRGGWWRWRVSGSFEHSSGCWLWSGREHQVSDTAAAAEQTHTHTHNVEDIYLWPQKKILSPILFCWITKVTCWFLSPLLIWYLCFPLQSISAHARSFQTQAFSFMSA